MSHHQIVPAALSKVVGEAATESGGIFVLDLQPGGEGCVHYEMVCGVEGDLADIGEVAL